ncbi:MAG: hypothetical protein U9N42_11305 [Campylobacterota bacterium]|nr:hypothetical protein [Campylobacterota bacterium]
MFKIENIKKIELYYSGSNISIIASMSAIYTYLMRLEKSVIFNLNKEPPFKLANCLPWYDKIREVKNSKHEQIINFDTFNDLALVEYVYELVNSSEFKINEKIATSLHVALSVALDSFQSIECKQRHLEMAASLLSFNASTCSEEIFRSDALSFSRAYGYALQNMQLLNSATVAYCKFEDLENFAIDENSVKNICKKLLHVVHVKESIVEYRVKNKQKRVCFNIYGTHYAYSTYSTAKSNQTPKDNS